MPAADLWRLCGWLAIPYSASLLAVGGAGIRATPPWQILLPLAAVALPYAYCLARPLLGIERILQRHPAFRPPIGVVLGALALLSLPQFGQGLGVLLLSFYAVLAIDARRLPAGFARGLVAALLATSLGLATVCNINYLLAPTLSGALRDPALVRLDVAMYEWLFARPLAYEALFPLARSPWAFGALETAYQVLFAELALVVVVLLWLGRDPTRFLRTVILSYFAAVLVFAAYPAVGPCIHQPGSFDPAFRSTATHHLMQRLTAEFTAAAAGAPGSGLAYFIAIPSLHAALATICQRFLAPAPLIFWTFAPINAAVLLSTVLLGYHYLVDVPCGVVLALGAIWVVERLPDMAAPERRPRAAVSDLSLPLPGPGVSLAPSSRTGN